MRLSLMLISMLAASRLLLEPHSAILLVLILNLPAVTSKLCGNSGPKQSGGHEGRQS